MSLKCAPIFLLSILVYFSANFTEAKIWTYAPIENLSGDARQPSFDAKYYVWRHRTPEGKISINMIDRMNGELISLKPVGSGKMGFPSYDNGKTVFRFYNYTTQMQEYYLWSEGVTTKLFEFDPGSFNPDWGYPPSYHSIEPFIQNDQIAVAKWDGNDYEIMLWDGSQLNQVTNNNENDYEPQLHNGTITWTGCTGDNVAMEDVFYWDGETITNVADGHRSLDEDSSQWNGKISFIVRAYDFNDSLWDVAFYEVASGGPWRYVAHLEGNDFEPEIRDNLIAWVNRKPEFHEFGTIYVSDGFMLDKLDTGSLSNIDPFIFDNDILFCSTDANGYYDLFLASYKTGKYLPLEGGGNFLEVWNDCDNLLILDDFGKIHLVDILEPSNLLAKDIMQIDGALSTMVGSANLFYVAKKSSPEINVYQIINDVIEEKGNINLPSPCISMEVKNGILYLGLANRTLQIIEINQLNGYPLLRSLVLDDVPKSLAINENTLYIGSDTGLSAVDISNVQIPTVEFVNTELNKVVDIEIEGDHLYALRKNSGLVDLNITIPLNPTINKEIMIADPFNTHVENLNFTLIGNHAFICTGIGGVLVVNLFDEENDAVIERFDTPGYASSCIIYKGFLYVADGPNGTQSYDISDYFFSNFKGDIDEDGDVDKNDLKIFNNFYGRLDCITTLDCKGDLDSDGDVDGYDLSFFPIDFSITTCN